MEFFVLYLKNMSKAENPHEDFSLKYEVSSTETKSLQEFIRLNSKCTTQRKNSYTDTFCFAQTQVSSIAANNLKNSKSLVHEVKAEKLTFSSTKKIS